MEPGFSNPETPTLDLYDVSYEVASMEPGFSNPETWGTVGVHGQAGETSMEPGFSNPETGAEVVREARLRAQASMEPGFSNPETLAVGADCSIRSDGFNGAGFFKPENLSELGEPEEISVLCFNGAGFFKPGNPERGGQPDAQRLASMEPGFSNPETR